MIRRQTEKEIEIEMEKKMRGFNLIAMLYSLPGILIGLSFHEFAHAFVSDRLGDPTPRQQGRLTLSPLAHVDPIGFIFLMIGGFGWAKPVQVNPRYYKHPRRDDVLVALSGPFMNLSLAILFSFLLKLVLRSNFAMNLTQETFEIIQQLFVSTIIINLVLFIFNLIPIPPLDGYHLLKNILPYRFYGFLYKVEQYGFIFLMLLIFSGATAYILNPSINFIFSLIAKVISL